jgi:hypothetical protein
MKGIENLDLPRHAESISAKEGKPLNLIIIANNDASLTSAMLKAGWQPPDPLEFGTMAKLSSAVLRGRNYPAAPIAPAFWDGRINDLGFVKPVRSNSQGIRHEARFWKSSMLTGDGKYAYVGLVSMTAGYK